MELFFREFLETTQTMKRRLCIYDFDSTLARVPEKPKISPEANAAISKMRAAAKRLKARQANPNSTGEQKQQARKEYNEAEALVRELLGGWDGSDWWGSEASLNDIHYPGKPVNDKVIEAFRQDRVDPQTHVAVITGRRGVVSQHVRNVLRHHNLYGRRVIPDSNELALQKHQDIHADEKHPHSHEEYYSGDLSTEPDYPKGNSGKPTSDTWSFKEFAVVKRLMNHNIEIIEIWDDRDDHIGHWQSMGVDLFRKWPNLKEFTIHRVMNTPTSHYIIDIPVKRK